MTIKCRMLRRAAAAFAVAAFSFLVYVIVFAPF